MAAPCEHVYAYYQRLWEDKHCIAFNLLRRGYYQAARGLWYPENNLFEAWDVEHDRSGE
jgi:hypothetical protein